MLTSSAEQTLRVYAHVLCPMGNKQQSMQEGSLRTWVDNAMGAAALKVYTKVQEQNTEREWH